MQNPWKKHSKVDPQREKGNRQISTELLLALIRAKLTDVEYQIVFFIIHKTWGFQKTSDAIPARQFMAACDRSERCIRGNINKLEEKKIIHSRDSERVHRGSPIKEYMVNKYYDTWFRGSAKELLFACGQHVNKVVDIPVDNHKKGCTETSKRVHGDVKKGCTVVHPQ